MPVVITLAHQKGGVGKSTLATNLRGYFSGGGHKTVLVDIDPQGSLSKLTKTFRAQAGREPEHLVDRNSIATYAEREDITDSEALAALIKPYDFAIIDTPPYLAKELDDIFAITNLVVIPCKASPLDYLAIGDTLNLIRAAQKQHPKLLAAIVLTMVIPGTDFTAEIRQKLEETEFPVLQTEIGNRVAYMRSLLRANSIIGDENRKAWDEMESFGKELISLLKSKYGK